MAGPSVNTYMFSVVLVRHLYNHYTYHNYTGLSGFPADVGWSINDTGISGVGRRRLSMND
jgi:hypothetical protein